MVGDIALIVVGGLAALTAALFEGAQLPDWLTPRRLEPGSFLFEALTTSGFVFPALGATSLTEGHPAWIRLSWILVAFVGGAALYGVPGRLTRVRRLSRQAAMPLEDPPAQRTIRKWRTPWAR